ncbi:MAG: toll/interleukin-1 receptor domain-containing protein [Pseudomonadota bacterium]
MATLVFSYSHVDENLRNELEKHLAPLKRQKLIETWHDRRIVAGEEFEGKIDQSFEKADIILLLVSPDFIDSDYCYNIEMQRSMERHNRDEVKVIPVILHPCDWHDLPFGKLLAATKDGKPITQYPTLHAGFYEAALAIKAVLKSLPGNASSIPAASAQSDLSNVRQSAVPTRGVERSSNLRIRRAFSDKDRDDARREYFQFVAQYFANSLAELKRRNQGIETDLQHIDTNSFEATIYVDGNRKCHCGIWIASSGHGGGDLSFNHNGVTLNSYNEIMSLHDDGYVLGLKPLGMGFPGRSNNSLLTTEGAAEYYWDMFIRPLQN